jgi:hypothetical protein
MSKRVAKKDDKTAAKDAKAATTKIDLDSELAKGTKKEETGIMPVD